MSLPFSPEGKLSPPNLEAIFKHLQSPQAMGTLTVTDGVSEKMFYFSFGGVRYIRSGKHRVDDLNHLAVEMGLASKEEIANAQAMADEGGGMDMETKTSEKWKNAIEVLVSQNKLTLDQKEELYQAQLEKELLDLFLWSNADYIFDEGSPSEKFYDPQYNSISLSFDMEAFLKTLREEKNRAQTLGNFITSEKLLFEPTGTPYDPKGLSAEEAELAKKVFPLVDGNHTVADLSEQVKCEKQSLYRVLFQLTKNKCIRKAGADKQRNAASGALQKEINDLEAALNQAIEQVKIRRRLATLYEKANDKAKAAENYHQLGDMVAQKDPEKAVNYYQQSVSLNPKGLEVHKKIFNFFANTGKKSQAVSKGIEFAKILRGFGMFNRAGEFFAHLLHIAPKEPDVIKNYAMTLEALNKPDEAAAQYQTLATVLEERGQKELTVEALKRVANLKPENKAVLQKIQKLSGKRFTPSTALPSMTWIYVVIAGVVALLALGGVYEIKARYNYLQVGNQIRSLVKKHQFDKAEELVAKLEKAYPMSMVKAKVQELSKEVIEVASRYRSRENFSSFQKALYLEGEDQIEEADLLYEKILANSPSENLRKRVEKRRQSIAGYREKAEILKRRHDQMLANLDSLSVGEMKKCYQMGIDLRTTYRDFVRKSKIHLPLSVETIPPGAEIYINGNFFAHSSPGGWRGKYLPKKKGNVLVLKKEGFRETAISLDNREDSVLNKVTLEKPYQRISTGELSLVNRLERENNLLLVGGRGVHAIPLDQWKVLSHSGAHNLEINHPPLPFQGGLLLNSGGKIRLFLVQRESLVSTTPRYAQKLDPSLVPWAVRSASGGILLVGDRDLAEVSPRTNQVVWKVKSPYKIKYRPVLHSDKIYFFTDNSDLYVIDLEGKGKKPINLHIGGGRIVKGPPIVRQNAIYMYHQQGVRVISPVDGTELWKYNVSGGAVSMAVIKEGEVLLASSMGELVYIKARGGQVEVLWRYSTGFYVTSPIVLHRKHVYLGGEESIRGEGRLLCAQLVRQAAGEDKFQITWILSTSAPIYASPQVGKKHIFATAVDGGVYRVKRD